jgi:hypothetical protein
MAMKKCKADIADTNITATIAVATAIANTTYSMAATGDATTAVTDTTDNVATTGDVAA